MKFSLLEIGQQFIYQGECYVKATPVVAHHCKTGKSKLIPRSAVLSLTTTAPGEPPATGEQRDAQRISNAFEAYQQTVAEILEQIGDDKERERLRTRLEHAGEKFLQFIRFSPDT